MKSKRIHSTRAFKIFKLKAYLDKGLDITVYIRYVLTPLVIATLNQKVILVSYAIYALVAFIVGFLWFKLHFVDAEIEVYNQANPFVREFRELSGSKL